MNINRFRADDAKSWRKNKFFLITPREERRIIIIYQMRRSGYNFHNFIHIKHDNVMIVCRSLELVFFPLLATFGSKIFLSSSPLFFCPKMMMIITHIVVLSALRTFKIIPHVFFYSSYEMKMQSRDIDNAGGKIIIIMCRRL